MLDIYFFDKRSAGGASFDWRRSCAVAYRVTCLEGVDLCIGTVESDALLVVHINYK